MNKRVGAGDALRESAGRRAGFAAGAAVSMRGGSKIGRADRTGIGVAAQQMLDAGAVDPGRGTEDAMKMWHAFAVRGTADSCERIIAVILVARRHRLHRGIDERDLRRKQIAKQSGNAPGDIYTCPAHRGSRQHFDAGDAAARVLPDRPAAKKRKALGDLLAAGAQRGAAPQIDDDRARHVAMNLQMRAHHFVGGEPAELHRGRRRQGARIGGEQIAAGRQHVAPSARRRTGRSRRDTAPVKRADQCLALRRGAGMPGRIGGIGSGAAKNVLAVLDGEVLEIAQPGVDAAQRVVGRHRVTHSGQNASFLRQSGALRRLDDQRGKPFAPPPVETVGLGKFVEQKFERMGVAGRPAGDKRRRQMTDGQRGNAPLGLRRFARIADDERIDHRQRPGDDFGKTFRGQRHGLAR
jgi:hypothetical protein